MMNDTSNVCELFNNELMSGNINYQLTTDDIVYELGTGKNMSCLYKTLVKNPIINSKNGTFTCSIPIIGQLFIGIEANEFIDTVSLTFKNYIDNVTFPCHLNNNIYTIFPKNFIIPICLIEPDLSEIILNVTYKSQPDNLVGLYGFLSQKCTMMLYDKLVYQLSDHFKIISGIPYIDM